jgi:hypothetical protein
LEGQGEVRWVILMNWICRFNLINHPITRIHLNWSLTHHNWPPKWTYTLHCMTWLFKWIILYLIHNHNQFLISLDQLSNWCQTESSESDDLSGWPVQTLNKFRSEKSLLSKSRCISLFFSNQALFKDPRMGPYMCQGHPVLRMSEHDLLLSKDLGRGFWRTHGYGFPDQQVLPDDVGNMDEYWAPYWVEEVKVSIARAAHPIGSKDRADQRPIAGNFNSDEVEKLDKSPKVSITYFPAVSYTRWFRTPQTL